MIFRTINGKSVLKWWFTYTKTFNLSFSSVGFITICNSYIPGHVLFIRGFIHPSLELHTGYVYFAFANSRHGCFCIMCTRRIALVGVLQKGVCVVQRVEIAKPPSSSSLLILFACLQNWVWFPPIQSITQWVIVML